MKQAVKTTKQAVIVLQDWLTTNTTDERASTETTIQDCEMRCACGETRGMEGFFEGDDSLPIARVAICDGCGDDSAFYDEVIEFV